MMALLVGGPLSGQYREMPDDKLTVVVEVPGDQPNSYTVSSVTTRGGEQQEVWGWSPLCYRLVRLHYQALEES
jgi:hypothetical protein